MCCRCRFSSRFRIVFLQTNFPFFLRERLVSTRPVTSDPVVRLYSVQSGCNFCFSTVVPLFLSAFASINSQNSSVSILMLFKLVKEQLNNKFYTLYPGVNIVNSAFTETPSGVMCRFVAMAWRFWQQTTSSPPKPPSSSVVASTC